MATHAQQTSTTQPQPSPRDAASLKVTGIVVHDGDIVSAHADALASHEPRFVPAGLFADDRGWSIMNQMQGVLSPTGQVNFSLMYPGVIKAWHRHQKQTDFWLVTQGMLKVGVYDDATGQAWMRMVGERQPGVVIIPPTLWHGGATVGPDSCGLLYYVSHAYDAADPDEERRAFDSVAGFPWGVRHG